YKKEPPDFSKKGIENTLVFRILKKTPFSQRPRKGYYAKGLLSYNKKRICRSGNEKRICRSG
ncbi:MAG: hypothetical protein IKA24_07585, partial [Mogibacterium sp.]|nr:hypothetical protein [Mogibacterium sp.]